MTIVAAVGGGNWTVGSTWVGGVAPTAADDAQLNVTSGNVTIDAGAVCRSLDCTGYIGTLTHTSGVNLAIGDGTAGASNIALKLVSGMTYTLGSATTSTISFISTSGTVQTIATGTKVLGAPTFNGAGSSYQFSDNFSCSTSNLITLTAGALDTNGKTVTAKGLSSSNTNTRSLTLGTGGTWNLTGNGDPWDFTVTTGLTFNCGTTTINASYSNGTFKGGGQTFYVLVITQNNAGPTSMSGANTFTTLTFSNLNSTDIVGLTDNITVTGTCTFTGNAQTNMPSIRSAVPGVQVTITAAVTSISNFTFCDIIGAGAAAWTGTSVGNLGGNSGITFTAAVDRHWVAVSGGNWNATSSWSATAGGASGATIPLPQDTVFFDAGSITSGSRTITVNVQCTPTIDFTNILNSPTIALSLTNGNISINGDLKLISGLTTSGTSQLKFYGRGAQKITTAGITLTNSVALIAFGGTYTLQDNLTISNTFTHTTGTIDANNFNFSSTTFITSNTNARSITPGSGTWSLTGNAATIWDSSTDTNLTISAPLTLLCSYSGSTGTRTTSCANNESKVVSFSFTAGSDTVATGTAAKNIDFTGFSGTWTNAVLSLYGNLTVSSGMSITAGSNALTLAATSGTKTITSNGKTIDRPVTVNGSGAIFQTADAFTIGATRALTVTAGTFTNGGASVALSAGTMSIGASGTLTLGTGTHLLTGTGTVWSNSGTVNGRTTCIFKITNTSNTAITFDGGSATYKQIWFSRGASTASNTLLGSNTFNTALKDDGTAAHSLLFTAGTTQTLAIDTAWQVSGNSGQLITVSSTTSAAHFITCSSGAISADYISLSYSQASGGANFYAGANSTDGGNNLGWNFSARGNPTNSAFFILQK